MSLNLVNLDDDNVRELMLQEFEADVVQGKVYLSDRLQAQSHETYINLMMEAIKSGNSDSLASKIQSQKILKSIEIKRKPSGGTTTAKVPITAHITLAEGEFNRFYLRGLCLKAIAHGKMIEIYRAKQVSQPRRESIALIGKRLDPKKLLSDLRTNIGVDTALRLPPGPNSGLSGHIV